MTEKTVDEIRFLTPEQVSRVLQVTPTTVRRLIRNDDLPANKIGKQWRISSDNLLDYLFNTATVVTEDDQQYFRDLIQAVLKDEIAIGEKVKVEVEEPET